MDESNALVKIDGARQLLAQARTVDEVIDIRDKAQAIITYLKQRDSSFEAQNVAAELKILAERKLGTLLPTTVRPGRPSKRSQHATVLPDGVTKSDSSRWQMMAQLPQKNFERHLAEQKEAEQEITTAAVLRVAAAYLKARRRDTPPAGSVPPVPIPSIGWKDHVQHGSFTDLMATLPANSVDLIFTDPPYDEDSIPLYPELARCAERVLKPKGSLIAYAGHYALGEIITGMAEHLRFWWTLAVAHKGGNARLPGKWVFVGWKPLVWFVKGGRRDERYVRDLIQSDTDFQSEDGDKDLHDWQQSECEASYLIEQLTNRGEVVLDPMCGSGTTLAAALRLGRVALGIDRDASSVEKSRNRIATK